MHTDTQRGEWLAPKELARELRLHVSAVYRAVERGQLPAVRLSESGAIRIPRSALDPQGQE
jgi:excisionase family DNA binding protein